MRQKCNFFYEITNRKAFLLGRHSSLMRVGQITKFQRVICDFKYNQIFIRKPVLEAVREKRLLIEEPFK